MLDFGWIRIASIILTMLPISLSGLGVREATFLYMLKPLGVAPEMIVAFSLAQYIKVVFFALLGAMTEIWRSVVSVNRKRDLLIRNDLKTAT